MTLAVLGDVTLTDGTGTELPLSPQRVQIVAALAAGAGSVVPRSSLLDDLWGEDTEASRHRLKTQIAQSRSMLGPELSIEFHLDGYRLCGSLERLDSTLFESLVTGGRQMGSAEACEHYERALQLWRSPTAFVGVDSLLVDDARRSLETLRVGTVLALADCEIELRRPRSSVDRVQQVFDDDPTRGDVTARLSTLLAFAGRQIEALRTIGRHREALHEIGLPPAADVVDLETRILRHDVAALVPAPVRRETGFHASGELIRRRPLEARVMASLRDAPVIVCGEAGVGKTVLTQWIVHHFEAEGRPVMRVGARPDPTQPMQAIADVIEQFKQSCPDLLNSELAEPTAEAAVARLAGTQPRVAVAISRERLIGELTTLVHSVVTNAGAMLVVEDAHWLDNSSAEIIGNLIDQALPHLLVTTRRPLGDELGDAWHGAVVIEVPAFSVSEVRQLLDLALPVRATDDLAEDLYLGTGGNGLFLRLKLDLLADGQLGRDLPPTLLHAVHERTAEFSRTTRDVLQTAALLGQSFPLAPLAMVHPHLHESLRDAVDERLVRLDIDSGIGEFVHGLVVDALIEIMPPAVRTTRHDQLCRALFELGESPTAIANQALGAEDLDPVRVVLCCLAAARQQAQVFEWASVIDWARIALRTHERCALDDPRIEIELRTLVGQALRRLNQSGSGEELGRAADLAHAMGDHDLFVRCVTELCLHGPTTRAGTVDTSARQQLELALAAPVDGPGRAELLSAAATLLAISDEAGLGRSLYRQALELAEAAGEPTLLRTVRMNAHLGLSHPDDIGARRRAAEGLLALDDHEARWEGSFLRFGLALIDADRPRFDESIDGLRRLTAIVKQRNQQRALLQVETVSAFISGQLDQAAQLADETFRLCLESYPASWSMGILAALLVPIREAQGRAAELLPNVSALVESSPGFITWHAVSAGVAYAAGDESAMAAELAHLALHDFRFVEDLTWTAVATTVCRPIWAMNDRLSADLLYERLRPYSGLMTWNGLSTHGPVDAGLACLAAVKGDAVALATHLREADALVDRIGAAHLRWPELEGLARLAQ